MSDRKCKACGRELVRRKGETPSKFNRRASCGYGCANDHLRINLIGHRIGNAFVVRQAKHYAVGHGAFWVCICEHGHEFIRQGYSLKKAKKLICPTCAPKPAGRPVELPRDLERDYRSAIKKLRKSILTEWRGYESASKTIEYPDW